MSTIQSRASQRVREQRGLAHYSREAAGINGDFGDVALAGDVNRVEVA